MKILITGVAGFIGFHVAKKFLEKKKYIIGIDNLNNYYDTKLKRKRIQLLKSFKNFKFNKLDICNYTKLNNFLKKNKVNYIIHLAAQAGVRYSIKNPRTYLNTNIDGFFNILEVSKNYKIKHLIFASSSSVYGGIKKRTFSEKLLVDHPISFYAATKKCNEILAHSYSHIYKIPITGLRFFTAYGPYGRPDMALYLFTKNILKNKKIKIFNKGNMYRDFTYIDDVVDAIVKLLKKIPKAKSINNPHTGESFSPFQIFNVGFGKKIKLLKFVSLIENNLKIKAKKILSSMQSGDIQSTLSDTSLLKEKILYQPKTSIEVGVKKFIDWYKSYKRIS